MENTKFYACDCFKDMMDTFTYYTIEYYYIYKCISLNCGTHTLVQKEQNSPMKFYLQCFAALGERMVLQSISLLNQNKDLKGSNWLKRLKNS